MSLGLQYAKTLDKASHPALQHGFHPLQESQMCLLTALETGTHCSASRQLCSWLAPTDRHTHTNPDMGPVLPTPRPAPHTNINPDVGPVPRMENLMNFPFPFLLSVSSHNVHQTSWELVELWSWPNQREGYCLMMGKTRHQLCLDPHWPSRAWPGWTTASTQKRG